MGQLALIILGVVLILGMSWGMVIALRKRQEQQESKTSNEQQEPTIGKESLENETAYHVEDPYENQPSVGDISHDENQLESFQFDPPTEEDQYANNRMAMAAHNALAEQTQQAHQAEMDLCDDEKDVLSWNEMIQENLKVRFGKQEGSSETAVAPEAGTVTKTTPLIVLNVMARRGQQFSGQRILEALRKHKLIFGKKRIFHAYDQQGQLQFSVASAVEPGYFDLENMHQFATPGLGFFMDVQQCQNPQAVFQSMVDVVKNIAQHLEGDVLDEQYQRFSDATLRESFGKIKVFQQRVPNQASAEEYETI